MIRARSTRPVGSVRDQFAAPADVAGGYGPDPGPLLRNEHPNAIGLDNARLCLRRLRRWSSPDHQKSYLGSRGDGTNPSRFGIFTLGSDCARVRAFIADTVMLFATLVRRLAAGGRWIRTLGPSREMDCSFEATSSRLCDGSHSAKTTHSLLRGIGSSNAVTRKAPAGVDRAPRSPRAR